MNIEMDAITFGTDGLLPVIVQDATNGKILTLAYMNKEAFSKTVETKEAWFFSRKRQTLWNKGETSGNKQAVHAIFLDCDQDALLLQVRPLGPACHKGKHTCFHHELYQESIPPYQVLEQLKKQITKRKHSPVVGSYTAYLFREGLDKVLKKIGEEASEVIIGAKNKNKQEVTWEIADLTYHTLVLMELLDVSFHDITNELQQRHNQEKDVRNE
ncbi:bifunctional phosphoribosyl-AMP cyclohydrolase/phosphoribosyl-ATP diphosphatase HisIE [Virgibacillus sp. AGTR]|uniref:bifunctional phosphoribosyl-AMP cyclohydrolase/phosphoribosyl-ATP diphosphatase HisIE n=1 Tax=Virgibacillus TaxID=84406 RepID=UPI00041E7576|nr:MULTISPECIES: bifunctional phosphoribosyl-AMP cyclohydrolase/phosphoribosyl-ATP diphosphatase HisIE [Bacillaceae]MCC2252027.1 bifunctional phosphoribosyl-AMP cyclohydrolase/phosphoribosyl-ATP diphosphatase HisIE [Virgibacillus sp. AGTR]MDY7046012.1 bifunctional phosphoribosyl-AMP cyclohydrolase/phosphoribosyl-ATP diphosphatase HisIE [Virgibacillus sp. M23]QRZ19579.1 bifunctional phosphoribosyl-AMP cyclohydrolase/phosphoribosyl-ATP diphosphatase HisIE [Virgibacillus sp. AGTR]WBX80754.1 bifunc